MREMPEEIFEKVLEFARENGISENVLTDALSVTNKIGMATAEMLEIFTNYLKNQKFTSMESVAFITQVGTSILCSLIENLEESGSKDLLESTKKLINAQLNKQDSIEFLKSLFDETP